MSDSKVNLVGFQLSFAQNLTMGHFEHLLSSESDAEIEIGQSIFVPYCSVVSGLFVGLVLIYKSRRKSLQSQRNEAGELVITKSELKIGTNGAEASMFVLNPKTMRGIVTVYQGSVSITNIKALFQRIHGNCRRTLVNAYTDMKHKASGNPKKDIREEGKKHYGGEFEMSVLVSQDDLDNLLNLYQSFSEIKITTTEGLRDAPLLAPLAPLCSSGRVSMGFDAGTPAQSIKDAIRAAFNPSASLRRWNTLRLLGKSYAGEMLNKTVGDNRKDYGIWNYDIFVDGMPSDKWMNYSTG